MDNSRRVQSRNSFQASSGRQGSSTSRSGYSSGGKQGFSANKKTFTRKRYCYFCKEERSGVDISPDYKNVTLLKKYITERGKIVAKSRSGLCAQHQKDLALAVKRARYLVLLPYSTRSEERR